MPKEKKIAVATEDAIAAARTRARASAQPGDWLSLVLDHHDQIRAAFERARLAPSNGGRLSAMKGLAMVLNAHSLAEEIVLYPALALLANISHAEQAYAEQTTAKIQMASLERLDPASEAWLATLEDIRGSVLQHMFEEESTWFLELKASADNQAKLLARYKEEFERYSRTGYPATNAVWDGPALHPAP
jgi:hypothetical protein